MARIDHSKLTEFIIAPAPTDEILQGGVPGCEGIQVRYINATVDVATLMGEAVVDKDLVAIKWFFRAFAELEKVVKQYWKDEYGEDISNDYR
jgi:hypothetical protein